MASFLKMEQKMECYVYIPAVIAGRVARRFFDGKMKNSHYQLYQEDIL